jgi:hypothetical protein
VPVRAETVPIEPGDARPLAPLERAVVRPHPPHAALVARRGA